MSVIAFEITDNKIQVAGDGRVITNGDKIEYEHFQKVIKVSDSLIIGVTGLGDTTGIFKKFVSANLHTFETVDNITDFLPMFKRFKEYLVDNYGFAEETLKELGGFLVANKAFHGVFYYDEYLTPYCVYHECSKAAFGSTGIYTSALLDCGVGLEEAIKKSAEKYTSINGNVTLVEIRRY